MSPRITLLLMLGVDAFILFFEASTLSISAHEAYIFFDAQNFVHYLVNASVNLFGHNDFALRSPMIILHLFSAVLLYLNSRSYLKRDTDRLWLVLVFMLLPGVVSSALMVDSAGIMIFYLFFLHYLYQQRSQLVPFVLPLFLLLDSGSLFLYFALFIYALHRSNRYFMIENGILFIVAFILYGFDTMGRPSGHFLDVLGLYATIFSPIVFLFMVYVIYRKIVVKEYDITLYVGGIVFLLSLLLSFRQVIHIEHFAPYMMLLLPLVAQTFFNSYRVRLRPFRKRYRWLLGIGFSMLALHFLLLLFNKGLYLYLDEPQRNFVYRMHIVKELAVSLKDQNVNCVYTANGKLQNRLKFYGIAKCEENLLESSDLSTKSDVTIRYMGQKVAAFNVTKVHNY